MEDKTKLKTIEVVAAIIEQDGQVLATQRGYGEYEGWWEFPGGKIEAGETRKVALVREIWEELRVMIMTEEWIGTVEHDYPNFHLTMHCCKCRILQGDIQLNEHKAAQWLDKENLMDVKWLPADVKVVDLIHKS